eukprot:4298339-Amphidinium_carterae.1
MLRQLYASEDSVEARLKIKDNSQPVNGELMAAMAALQNKNKALQTKEPLYAWLETTSAFNQKELMGILRHVNGLNVHWPSSRTR